MTGKSIAALAAALAIAGFIGGMFLWLLQPAAARERAAACRALRPSASNEALGAIPRPAPDFAVQDHTGAVRKLSELRGKVVFLNFWAQWCPPCIDEMPSLEDLQEELGDEGLEVVALASNPQWDEVRAFFPEGTNLTVWLDPSSKEDEQIGDVARAFGVPALPETFIIDREGTIRYYYVNKRDWHSGVAVTCMRSLLEED